MHTHAIGAYQGLPGPRSLAGARRHPRAWNADSKHGEMRCEKVRKRAATSESQTVYSACSGLLLARANHGAEVWIYTVQD
jgi:hypothetical protein